MAVEQLRDFDEFWRVIDLNESYVRRYGHAVWHPGLRDRWDEQLERAYEAIRPHLSALRRPSLFTTPAGAKGFNPYEAETAHQALMFFLNPPENMFGQIWVLTSPEYLRIKQETMAELERLRSAPGRPERPARRPPSPSRPAKRARRNTRRADDKLLLRNYLLVHHLPSRGGPVLEPLSQGEIAEELGWDQPRVSRAMKALFKVGAMKAYKSQLASGQLRGFLKRGEDGTTDVEAFDEG